jgi:hypothetical protein
VRGDPFPDFGRTFGRCRQGEAERGEGGAHALPAFAYGLVRQANDHEGDLPAGELDLHVDRLRLDAAKRECRDPCDHAPVPSRLRITQHGHSNK